MRLIIFSVAILMSCSTFADTNGLYQGTINLLPTAGQPKGRIVPITVSLKQSQIDVAPSNSSSLFLSEKKMGGSFVLDGEAGPYEFASTEYDPESGKLILQYARTGPSGTLSSTPSLIFECLRLKDGSCSGNLTSGINGLIGTFTIQQTTTAATNLSVTPKYVGSWKGTITFTDSALAKIQLVDSEIAKTVEFDFGLGAGTGTIPNTDNFEIASSPLKIASAYMNGKPLYAFFFNAVYMDYLKGESVLTFTNNSPGGNNASFSMTVDFEDDDSISGNMTSSMFGTMASFTAKKVE